MLGSEGAGEGADRDAAKAPRARGSRLVLLLLGLIGVPLFGVLGWIASDELEKNNDFCNACHLRPGVPLHIGIREDFDARPPVNLASAHAIRSGPEDAGHSGDFRCIDCHGGVGLADRARIKALAARDAFFWVIGDFEEPQHMRHPLRDASCTTCHPAFEQKVLDFFARPAFHDLAVHNADFEVRCVECHLSHEKGGNVQSNFLVSESVRAQCARCHTEFEAS